MRFLSLCGLAFAATICEAQSFHCDRFTIDAGGERLMSVQFTLNGALGQPDAASDLSDGRFALRGGFWVSQRSANPCPGDADGDGFVNFTDLNLVLDAWGGSNPSGDVDGDGAVNFEDLNLVLGAWNAAC